MKANELMIGDWVLYNGKPHYVIAIESDGMVKITTPDKSDEWCRATWPDRFEPIPLTPEILEKNGFYYDEDRKAYLMGTIFQVKPERYGLFSIKICGCPYSLNTVHELQHAIRLCGIDKEIEL